MGYSCKLTCSKECDGCGACMPQEDYVLYCDHCGREVEDLEIYSQIGDHAFCQECVDNSWRQWYRSPDGFPARIKRFRTKMGMQQKDFAKEIGVGKSTVSMWERGERKISRKMLDKIFERFGTEP